MITTLKDWKLFEKKQDKKKDLIIVDVQQEFSKYFTKSYIEDLQKYCLEFGRVFQIWDDVSSDEPSYDWPNLTINLKKSYGGELDKSDIEHYVTSDKVEQIEKEFDNKKPGWYIEREDGSIILYVSDNDTFTTGIKNHPWFYVSKEIVDVIQRLGNTDREVTLVGGAKNECLYDVEMLLKTFNVKYEVNEHFVYSNKGCNIAQRIEKEKKEKKVKESLEYIKESLLVECCPPKLVQAYSKLLKLVESFKHKEIINKYDSLTIVFENLGDMDTCQEYLNNLNIETIFDDANASLDVSLFQKYFGF